MGEKGVFLHTKNLDSEFMVKCLQMLVNNFPQVKITLVEADDFHFGYRVHFSSPKEDVVLAKKHLIVSGKNVRIVPLRTSLTIHGAPKNGTKQFDRDLRKAFRNKFGKLLDFHPVPNPENVITENLRACVDVPELEELEVFNHEGYPDMFVCLPHSNETLRVTFYCRRCKNGGHVQQNCPFQTLKVEPKKKIKDQPFQTPEDEVSNSSRSRHSISFDSEEEDFEGDERNSSDDCSEEYFEFSKGCSSSYNDDKAGPSWRNSAPPKSTTAVEYTSPKLQKYINMACKESNIIDRNQLDDFFNSVKNRRNPSQIAKAYISSPRRLKPLLRKIIKLFNTMSHDATKEDRQFIKWLKELLKRFDGNNPRSSVRGKGSVKWKSSGQYFYSFP